MEVSKTIKLQYPVVKDDDSITEVTVRRIKVGDFARLDLTPGMFTYDVHKQRAFVSNNTGLTIEQLDEIDTEDYARILNQLTDFLGLSAASN